MNFSAPKLIIIVFVALCVVLPLCRQNSVALGAAGGRPAREELGFRNVSPAVDDADDADGSRRTRYGASRAARSDYLGSARARVPQDGGRVDVYFGIAVPVSNQVVLKAFNRTVANLSAAFMAGEYGAAYRNISLQPFFIELPENEKFSSSLLVSSCAAMGGRRAAALAVLGRSSAAATAALAAAQAGLPVLRAAPEPAAFHTTLAQNIHPLEVRLEATAREMLQALRSLLLHTHWHSFTVLADTKVTSSISLRKDLAAILHAPPLSPTILDLPSTKTQHALFRCLADVSRSTRGVIVLISDVSAAQRVLQQAKRLNMLDGHFVWLWIDTDITINRIKHADQDPFGNADQYTSQGPDPYYEIETERRAKGEKHAADHRERHAAGKRTEDTERFKRNDEIVKVVENKAQNLIMESETRTDLANGGLADELTKSVNESDRTFKSIYSGKIDENLKFNMDKYTTSASMGSTSSFYKSNLMYKDIDKSSETLSRTSKINVNRNIDQFQDHIGSNNYNLTDSFFESHFVNINSKRGIGSSNSAAHRETPEANNEFLQSDEHNHENDMFIKEYELFSDKSNYINSLKHTEFGVKFLDTNLNLKPTVKSLNVFNKLGSFRSEDSATSGSRRTEKRTERLWAFSRPEVVDPPPSPLNMTAVFDNFPVGLLALRPLPIKTDRQMVRAAVRAMNGALRRLLAAGGRGARALSRAGPGASCWSAPSERFAAFSAEFVRELNDLIEDSLAGLKYSQDGADRLDKSLVANFEILNLVPNSDKTKDAGLSAELDRLKWRSVGRITGRNVQLDTIVWPGGDIVVSGLSAQARSVFRVVTALAPPFVMESELDEDGQCLRGLPCHRVLTSDKDNLTLVFNEMETQERLEEEAEEEGIQGSFFPHLKYQAQSGPLNEKFLPFQNKYKYRTNCCYGLTMDLLENIAQELEFDFHLYIVSDGLFGTRKFERKYVQHREIKLNLKVSHSGKPDFRKEFRNGYLESISEDQHAIPDPVSEADMKWNGIVGDLVSGAAHMSFASLSVSSARSEVIDFSAPYFFSGVSFLAAPQEKSEIPLLAFLLPFSPELWIAIFTSLNVTAIAVAIYEWLSPFGLNPWGRQRSKNFSMSSALWVMWGLLCGHLVAFKAPKSWPNKFLINVWGGFSVIFVASYTANIAALIAGLFFHNAVDDYNDRNLLTQRVGTPRASAAEYYVQRSNHFLWDHMKKYALADVEDGIQRLRNGSLDLLIADTPILDYYRATDHGCKLQRIGETFNEDTYAVGMAKGFPLKDSISALISKYSSNGYMDILQEKWYGGLPCFKMGTDFGIQPRPLGVAAVAGVFILLGVGMAVGCLILLVEHLFYKYTLPLLRHKPKGTIWRSRNIMFFSQKLYRFINCVELVSPHHAARELVHTLRQGQITSLFQKSVKRKEHEQRRRRKSKAQFFEMIQEIRRVQQEERDQPLEAVTEIDSETTSPTQPNSLMSPSKKLNFLSLTIADNKVKSPMKSKIFSKDIFKSPRVKNKKRKQSTGGLNVRRFSTDSVFSSHSMLRFENTSVAIGRRLSKDTMGLTNSPPDINSRRSSYMDFDKFGSRSPNASSDSLEVGKKLATIPKYKGKQFLESSPSSFGRNIRNRPGLGSVFGQTNDGSYPLEARSFQNVSEQNEKSKESETSTSVDDLHSKPELSQQSELQKKHKKTFEELQEHLNKKGEKKNVKTPIRRCISQQTDANKNHHQIKIQIEDHSSPLSKEKNTRQRHKSLEIEEKDGKKQTPRTLECFLVDNVRRSSERSLGEPSEFGKDLHVPVSRSRSGSYTDKVRRSTGEGEDELPPAPPYPNVAPRNSDGKSPLERLTRDELVLLWRSSESELRSHLLTALREKENSEPP